MTQANIPATPLIILLFDGMEITVNGVPLPRNVPAKVRLLLATLALKHADGVTSKAVAARLWPKVTTEQAGHYLNRSVWQLRTALGPASYRLPSPKQLARTLSIKLDPSEVDVVAFDQAIISDQRAALETAVAHYRGPLLNGISGTTPEMDAWIAQERLKRARAYQDALKRLVSLAQSEGDVDAALDYLRRFVEVDPFWEPAQREFMTALAQSGNLNAALRQYRELRTALLDRFQREPEEETTDLYNLMPNMAPKPNGGVTPPAPAPPRREPLVSIPCALTELIGREEELSEIQACLRRHRLVTLNGAGGVGKTRLSMQIAEAMKSEFADGTLFIELDAISDPDLVIRTVASALGIEEELGSNTLAGIRSHLKPKTFLLILDNCEHLLHACAHLARQLLTSCPNLKIMTTSRTALGILGAEKVWHVPSLTTPDPGKLPEQRDHSTFALQYPAIQLFNERATASWRQFQISDRNAKHIVEICHRLDGIPLAIELAAVRARTMPPEIMAGQLREFFRLREGIDMTVMPRQQTLYSLIEWSYDLLTGPEQTLLRRLAVFRGGWKMKAVRALYEEEEIRPQAVAELHTRLMDQSLVFRMHPEEEDTRFRMLETVREFCLDKLRETGEHFTACRRHGAWAVGFTEDAAPRLKGDQQKVWLQALEREHDNFRAALSWAVEAEQPEIGMRIGASLWRFWHIRGYLQEGLSWLKRLLSLQFEAGTPWHITVLNGAGSLANQQAQYQEARGWFEERRRLCEAAGDEEGLASALASMGNVVLAEGEIAEARRLFESSLALFRKRADRRGMALTLANLANVASAEGDFPLACSMREQSLAIFRESGDLQNVALGLNNWANNLINMKAYVSVRPLLEESLSLGLDLSNLRMVAHSFSIFRGLAFCREQYYRTAVLEGAEEALRETIHLPVPPKARAEYYEEQATVRQRLGDEAYAAAYARGRAMTTEQAAEYALEEDDADS